MSKAKPRFFMSPVSGRLIRSSGKTFQHLKEQGYIIDKHPCLYNIKSAQKCVDDLLKLYPSLVYPPSSFIDIPKTYKGKNSKARSFVINEQGDIQGFIDRKGRIHKLDNPLPQPSSPIPTVDDPSGSIGVALAKAIVPNADIRADIEQQIQNGTVKPSYKQLLYNPVHNDFVPVIPELSKEEQLAILDTINDRLIPSTLPTIGNTNISGVLIDDKKTIIGVVNGNNEINTFSEPVNEAVHASQTIPTLQLNTEHVDSGFSTPVIEANTRQQVQELCRGVYNLDKTCTPCETYNLVWDADSKKCKVKLSVVYDEKNEIVGYM